MVTAKAWTAFSDSTARPFVGMEALILFADGHGEKATIIELDDGSIGHCLFDGDSLFTEPTHFIPFDRLNNELDWQSPQAVDLQRLAHNNASVVLEVDLRGGQFNYELVTLSEFDGMVCLGNIARASRSVDGQWRFDYSASSYNVPVGVTSIARMDFPEPEGGEEDPGSARYFLALNSVQACQLSDNLDLVARLGIGQFDELASALRKGVIRNRDGDRLSSDEAKEAEQLLNQLQRLLGYADGESQGIANRGKVNEQFRSAFEIKKSLDRQMALNGGATDDSCSVRLDGNTLRLTNHPAPRVLTTGKGEGDDIHQFAGDKADAAFGFSPWWRARHLESPEHYPMTIPTDNIGVLDEMFEIYENSFHGGNHSEEDEQ